MVLVHVLFLALSILMLLEASVLFGACQRFLKTFAERYLGNGQVEGLVTRYARHIRALLIVQSLLFWWLGNRM